MRQGPLSNVRIVEFTGIGPVPYGAMVLADMGAQIIRVDRPGGYPAVTDELDFDRMEAASVCNRSRPMIRIDLKSEAGRDLVMRLIGSADGLVEGYRPGTMEKLGLGPEACLKANPRLAFVRVTGWGQEGPRAMTAGHDLNYIGVSGALSLFGRNGTPAQGVPPLIGDMAGGALFMVIGMLSAILEARASGKGQVVDAAILDGSANLTALLVGLQSLGLHHTPAGGNILDGGRHYYRTYLCSDGLAVAVGAIEPGFRRVLLERMGLDSDPDLGNPRAENEAACTAKLAAAFASKPRQHWVELFFDSDGCVTPVHELNEAAKDPQNMAREIFREIDGVLQPGPAPRFLGTPGQISMPPGEASRAKPEALQEWGIDADEIAVLRAQGVIS